MKILTIIFILTFCSIWGYLQPKLFPIEKYGYLFIFTSIIGGYLIGYFGAKFFL